MKIICAVGDSKEMVKSMWGGGLWKGVLNLLVRDIFSSPDATKEKEGNVTKMRKNKNIGKNIVCVVVIRNQASVNKINNYLITFIVS